MLIVQDTNSRFHDDEIRKGGEMLTEKLLSNSPLVTITNAITLFR